MQFRSFDIANMVLEESSKRFAPEFKQNEDRTESLKRFFEAVDTVAKEDAPAEFEVRVDENSREVHISFVYTGIWEKA